MIYGNSQTFTNTMWAIPSQCAWVSTDVQQHSTGFVFQDDDRDSTRDNIIPDSTNSTTSYPARSLTPGYATMPHPSLVPRLFLCGRGTFEKRGVAIASFPGLPRLRFLIACSILQLASFPGLQSPNAVEGLVKLLRRMTSGRRCI